MKTSEFEQHLSQQPLREVPAEWRAEILSAAVREAKPEAREAAKPRWDWLSVWLRPARLGWTAIAAAWALILVLNHAARPEPISPELLGRGASATWSTWEEHQRALARHLEVPEPQLSPGEPAKLGRQSALPLNLPFA